MDISKRMLMQEYYNNFHKLFRPLELTGFFRFAVKDRRFKEINFSDMVYNIVVLIIANVFASYMIYVAVFKKKYLSLAETITIIHFSIFANLMLFDITFGDKRKGLDIVQSLIDIDTYLGAEETRFMRIKALKHYIVLCVLVAFTQLAVCTYMYVVFEVSIAIHVVGSLYFGWLFCCYYDFCFFLLNGLFLSMRVRYLNVALMKITRMNPQYVPDQLLFNSLFWSSEYDDKVVYHNLAVTQDFTLIIRKLFNHLRRLETCYKFPITLGVLTTVMGTFVSVQTFAMYIESSELVLRAFAISSWAVVSWLYILIVSLQTDMVYRQIEHTKLICAYSQLKPTNTDEIFKLTKTILRTLEVRDARISVFGMVDFNTRLVFKLAASTLVYITVQLQLTFPQFNDAKIHDNSTATLIMADDPAAFKHFFII